MNRPKFKKLNSRSSKSKRKVYKPSEIPVRAKILIEGEWFLWSKVKDAFDEKTHLLIVQEKIK